MKKITYILLLFISVFASAQDWEESYKQALILSERENKPVILVFAGSDWCAPCIKLDKTVWQSQEFIEYAKKNYILYKADFPRKKSNRLPEAIAEQNRVLADAYNPKGYFPLILILNSDEKVLGTTGYKKFTPDQYISLLNSFIK